MTRGAILSVAVLLALFEIGSCMRCYQCISEADGRECEFFPEHNNGRYIPEHNGRFLVDCNVENSYNYRYLRNYLPAHLTESVAGAPKYCAKLVTKTGVTIRTCLDANPLDPYQTCRALERSSYDYGQVSQQMQHCSICERDLCNGSSKFAVSLPLAFLAFFVTIFFKQ